VSARKAQRRSPRKRSRTQSAIAERGVAMIIVLVGLAVLAVVANEIRYNSIVELRLAANARDDLRATYLARSGLAMSRLMLKFQKQLDQVQIPNLGSLLQQYGGLLGGAGGGANGLSDLLNQAGGAAGGNAVPPPQTMSIQLWRMARIDCYMLQGLIPQNDEQQKFGIAPPSHSKKFDFDEENPELAKAQEALQFGGFKGCFESTITDEEERINIARLNAPALSAAVTLGQLMATLSDKKYAFLFEHEDSHHERVQPADVILAMRDWIDEDEAGDQINTTGQGDPFIKGFSDENGPYQDYSPRYHAKNAGFDSLDELYMVHGVNDRFMAAFKDKFTVYPDINARLNINTDDPMLLWVDILSVADPSKPDPRLADPVFIDTVIQKIRAARVFALFGMSVTDFVNIIQAAGVAVNPTILNNVQNQRFLSDKSSTYRVKVKGTAGDVTRTITTVIRLDDGLGRLVYWRED